MLEMARDAIRMVQSGICPDWVHRFWGGSLLGHVMGYSSDALDKLLKILGNSPIKMCTNLGNVW